MSESDIETLPLRSVETFIISDLSESEACDRKYTRRATSEEAEEILRNMAHRYPSYYKEGQAQRTDGTPIGVWVQLTSFKENK